MVRYINSKATRIVDQQRELRKQLKRKGVFTLCFDSSVYKKYFYLLDKDYFDHFTQAIQSTHFAKSGNKERSYEVSNDISNMLECYLHVIIEYIHDTITGNQASFYRAYKEYFDKLRASKA